MLQINKKATITLVKYNLQFLLWNKKIANNYLAKKTISNLITLRSPKHFNIGKHKIFSLNYKTRYLFLKFNSKVNTKSIINSSKFIYLCLKKRLTLTPTIFIHSIKFTVKTFFKLTWLGMLFFFWLLML